MDAPATSFPPASRADWLALVEGVLKGAPYDARMVTTTLDGLAFDALPAPRGEPPILARAPGVPWRIIARIDHSDPAAANAQLLEDLEGGADGATLVFASSPAADGFGLPETAEAIGRVLEGVLAEIVTLRIECGGFRGRDLALAVSNRLGGFDPARLDLRTGLDPIGDLAARGAAPIEWDALAARLGQTVAALRARGLTRPMVRADGRLAHDAGASEAQELAGTFATALAYLRALDESGLDLTEAARLIEVTLAADVDLLATLAKARAARLLWRFLLGECGLEDPPPLALHMETSWRMLTRHDTHVNLLRGTIAAFGAGVGGADSLTVLPFTAALGLPDGFARRLARNTQHVLIEEANLHRVTDPAAGAGAIEERTEAFAGAAWEMVRAIEKEGGMVEALTAGTWQRRLAQTQRARATLVATRRLPITGTSEYALPGEAVPAVLAPAPPAQPTPFIEGAIQCEPLSRVRLAEAFEQLRARGEASGAAVRLLPLGSAVEAAARLGFARALFAAGGLKVEASEAGLDDEALVAAARGAPLACLCGPDMLYETRAAPLARALKAAGVRHLLLAGKPGGNEPPLRAAGMDGFLFAGCDALAVLGAAQRAPDPDGAPARHAGPGASGSPEHLAGLGGSGR
ncbi:methylmalonyl-CoA mutase family protein [Ancylobacter sp. 6x-1]|uniref:Methylmalonyl-CoA mutase family protein n=1 Tax=Ancylobacter crimeensis TaxID=2579147 RepID=A0ABT0DFB7_9HYPH|nr:methylmalonyl-CoA mutase family protein [Ancylobacter crimeensis]MCK0198661.1 methylmalonyl-CoA mutase family protein [Ancylobacter crimeensis]